MSRAGCIVAGADCEKIIPILRDLADPSDDPTGGPTSLSTASGTALFSCNQQPSDQSTDHPLPRAESLQRGAEIRGVHVRQEVELDVLAHLRRV